MAQGRHRVLFTLVVAGTAIGAVAVASRTPRLVWNATASAPVGLYVVTSAEHVSWGDLVLALPPPNVRSLAATRGYLPDGVPLVKRVAARSGETICSSGRSISINRHPVAERLQADSAGRPLPAWSGCRLLRADEVFLLMKDVPNSFDGRYFGPIRRSAVLGILRPIWTR
jgi:conjugative transfer signal peptidase TraF